MKSFAEHYQHGVRALGGACPIEMIESGGFASPIRETGALHELLADNECAHGRLAGDPTDRCGCWPGETR